METRSTNALRHVVAGFAVATVALSAPAQQGKDSVMPQPPQPVLEFVNSSVLLGASVMPDELTTSTERDAKPAREQLARMRDLVVDTTDGRLTLAAVEVDGKSYAVPLDKLAWRGGMWRLTLGAQELTQQNAFDPAIYRAAERAEKAALDAAASGLRECGLPARYRLASHLDGLAVVTDDDKAFGTAAGLSIEIASRRVAFVEIARDGDATVPVPWPAIALLPPRDALIGPIIRIAASSTRMTSAPTTANGDQSLDDIEFRDRVYSFFDVTPPAFEGTVEGDRAAPRGREGDPQEDRPRN